MQELLLLRVLIIEDDPDDAELLRMELQRDGFELACDRVESESELRAALSTRDWDIILSDFAMPGFDGLRAFEVVQEHQAHVPFIFISGALGEERAVQAMRAGARDYLLKGSLGRLSVAVRRELGQAAVHRAQREAEETASRQQRRLAMAVRASGAGVFEWWVGAGATESHETAYVSHRWAEIVGCERSDVPRDETFGDWIRERIHPDDRALTGPAFVAFTRGVTPRCRFEPRLRHASGHWVPVEVSMEAIERGSDGRVRHLGGVMIDLTERRRLEEQLLHAQKMEGIGRLAGGISHDFNNLLTAILSFGDFVLGELAEGSPAHEDMQQVISAAEKAATLTGQLLAFSRQKPIAPKVVDLNQVLVQMERMMRRLSREDIDLVVDLAPALWNVRCDSGAFEQVMVNLVINAKDAMPNGGTLRIATENVGLAEQIETLEGVPLALGDYVAIEVTDDGTGMDEQTRHRVFEPFFTTKSPGQGTGLGLSTCYGIIKQAGGHIELKSEPGQGSTFRILLPRVTEPTDLVHSESRAEHVRGHETVLVVEDDDSVRLLVTRALTAYGYTVYQAADGDAALALLAEHQASLDLLLTDLVMPGLGGAQLADRLSATHPDVRVMYMSGYSAQQMSDLAGVESGGSLLQKPFTPQGLLHQVRRFLDRQG